MIDRKHKTEINKSKAKRFYYNVRPFLFFIVFFYLTLNYEHSLNKETEFINDKIIDVCSIFFGIFMGCLYLFDKVRKIETKNEIIKTATSILNLCLTILVYSLVLQFINCRIPYELEFVYLSFVICLKLRVIIFALYVGLICFFMERLFYFIKILNALISI